MQSNVDALQPSPAPAGRVTGPFRFWLLHLSGWLGYGVLSYLSALAHGKPAYYIKVTIPLVIAGVVLTWALRLVMRAAWKLPPAAFVTVTVWPILGISVLMGMVYVSALGWGYCVDCRPDDVFGYLAYIGSFVWVILAWAALYFGIKKHEEGKVDADRALRATAIAHEAQLKMLRYQLNPHFLFNTLNAISTLILDEQGNTANRMVMRLSAFLRHSLDNDPMQQVTLAQELEAIRLYLDIEKLRFEDRLTVIERVDPGAENALLPSLLLQPLIENAIKYAIAPRVEGGRVEIEAHVRDGRLIIRLSDDGPGCELLQRPAGSGHGVGLANTRERLRVLYGEEAQSVRIESPSGGGCRIVLELPYRTRSRP
ncbi:MAG: histidine kinase [Xanthomonadales bacterium]|nr:histidine kinase [Xanthomonadales bacterium]MCB1633822.1 histidine kinase [Xanthomonadales bacterium]